MGLKHCDVLLLLPPFYRCFAYSPYPSIYWLSQYIGKKNFSTTVVDCNQDFADSILNQENLLDSLLEQIERCTHKLDLEIGVVRRLCDKNHPNTTNISGHLLFRSIGAILEYTFSTGHFDNSEKIILLNEYCRKILDNYLSNKLKGYSFTLAGISVPFKNLIPASLMAAQFLKDNNFANKIVAGGPVFSLLSDGDILDHFSKSVDVIIRGEGEECLVELLSETQRLSPKNFEDNTTLYKKNCPCYILHVKKKFDLSSSSNFRIPLYSYFSKKLPVLESRGCTWAKCAYCDYRVIQKGYRARLPKYIVDDMEYYSSSPGNEFLFELVNECLSPESAFRISEEIIRRGLNVRWTSFLRIDSRFDCELLTLMKKAGYIGGVIGLETTCDRILNKISKGYRLKDVLTFFENTRKAGLRHRKINIIVNLPGITKSEAIENVDILSKYSDCFYQVAAFPLQVTKTSLIGKKPSYFGLVIDETGETSGSDLVGAIPYNDPYGMSTCETEDILRSIDLLNEDNYMEVIYGFTGNTNDLMKRKFLMPSHGEIIEEMSRNPGIIFLIRNFYHDKEYHFEDPDISYIKVNECEAAFVNKHKSGIVTVGDAVAFFEKYGTETPDPFKSACEFFRKMMVAGFFKASKIT